MDVQNYYQPTGRYVILLPETRTKSGIILGASAIKSLAVEVVGIGPDVTQVRIGDKIMFDGNAFQFTVTANEERQDFYQIHEANIIGKVLNEASVTATEPTQPQ